MSNPERIFAAFVELDADMALHTEERYRIRAWTSNPARANVFRERESISAVEYVRADTVMVSIADSLKRIADCLTLSIDERNALTIRGILSDIVDNTRGAQ